MSESGLFGVLCFWAMLKLSQNACPSERFGPNCEFQCHCLRKCNKGDCSDDLCSFGFMDPPKCQTGCPKQKFGVNCMFDCKCPENDTCNNVNGWCSSNKCKDGFGGAGCQKRVPFLSDPPVVDIIAEKYMLISWKPWSHGFQLTNSSILIYLIEAQNYQDIDSASEWITLAKVRDTDESGQAAWIMEKTNNFDVALVTTSNGDQSLQRVRVLFQNPEPDQPYKFRIGISVLKDKRPPFKVDPSPVTPKWHSIHCGAPSHVPTRVTANVTTSEDFMTLTISWEILGQNSSKCDEFWGHEVSLIHLDLNGNNIISSFNVTWPHLSLLVSNITENFVDFNSLSYAVAVRVVNKWGVVGPWSEPSLAFLIVESTTLGEVGSDLTMSLQGSSHLTTSPLSQSPSSSHFVVLPTSHLVTPSLKVKGQSPSPTVRGRSVKWTLLERNETHLELLHEGGSSAFCQIKLLKHLIEGVEPYVEVLNNVVILRNVKGGIELSLGGLEIKTYYTVVVSCPSLSIHSSLTIATSLPPPRKPPDLKVLKVTSSIVVVHLPRKEGRSKEQKMKRKRDYIAMGLQKRSYLVIVEKLGEIGCCSVSYLIESGQITWDDQRRKKQHVDFDMLPNSATSGMYRKSYYLVAKLNLPSNVSKSAEIFEEFTVGDGVTYGKYNNPPLKANRSYVIWFAIEDTLDGLIRRSFSRSPVVTLLPEEGAVVMGSDALQEVVGMSLITVAIFLTLTLTTFFALRWIRQKRDSRLFKRLRQARLQSLAYLDKEGFRWRCDDVFTELVESAPFSDSFCSSPGKSISPFTFPAPIISSTVLNNEDFLSPIPVKDLRSFCERHVSLGTRLPANPVGEDQADVVSSLITKEFASFPTGLTDVVASSYRPDIITSMDSYHLNVVLPYERNRVRLRDRIKESNTSPLEKTLEDVGWEDHLNASRVRTLGRGSCIVTQTLTPSSCSALWLLIWQEAITHIIDLDSLDQWDASIQGDSSCPSPGYWPHVLKRREVFGDLEVELVSKMDLAHYAVRVFWIGKADRGKFVHQWHYHAWTPQSIPVHHISFLNFIRALGEDVPLGRECSIIVSCQTLLHCNRADGRSGIFLALDALIAQGLMLNVIDVKSCVALLRSERHNLVKTLRQYCFIYECLAEEFDHSGTRKNILRFITGLRSSEDKLSIPAEVAYDHRLMTSCSYRPLKASMSEGFASCVPPCKGGPEQMGLVMLDSYWLRKAFLIERSSRWIDDADFWKAIVDNEVVAIVSLTKIMVVENADGGAHGAHQLCLSTGRSWSAGIFTVACVLADKLEESDWATYRLSITHHSDVEDVPPPQRNVEVIQLDTFGRSYKDSVASVDTFLRFIHFLKSNNKWSLGSNPTVLLGGPQKMQNINEVGSSVPLAFDRVGVFLASWMCIEQAVSDGVVDVFGTCRLLRSYLSAAISSKEEYQLTCLVVSSYMRTHSQPDNDFSRRHLLTGFHWRETRLDVSQEQPSVNRRNVMFLPISSSSMLPFARKKQSPSTRIKRDFSGSYQKFPSPRASPLLANKVPTDEEDGSPLTSEKQPAPQERRPGRFFDSLRREASPNI